MGAKLHKFKDGCARLKPMKCLKVKIKNFWGCIVADVEKWIFDPLVVWEWEVGTNLLMYTANLGRSLWRNAQRSFLACPRQVEEPSQYHTHISMVQIMAEIFCLHLVFLV